MLSYCVPTLCKENACQMEEDPNSNATYASLHYPDVPSLNDQHAQNICERKEPKTCGCVGVEGPCGACDSAAEVVVVAAVGLEACVHLTANVRGS
jgi:hypothetical protein